MTTPPASALASLLPDRLPPEKLQVIQAALLTIAEVLHPHVVGLTTDERRALPRTGPKTTDFKDRAMSYGRAMPQYVPSFVNLDECERFIDTADTLTELQHPVNLTRGMLDDTVQLANSLSTEAAMAIWDALKAAAKRGMHDAEAAAADLAARYPSRKGRRAGAKGSRATGNEGTGASSGT